MELSLGGIAVHVISAEHLNPEEAEVRATELSGGCRCDSGGRGGERREAQVNNNSESMVLETKPAPPKLLAGRVPGTRRFTQCLFPPPGISSTA
jgi:hypothetical protein